MSSITQVLNERDRLHYGKGGDYYSKVVCTGKQERALNGPRKKSGTDLWKLRLGTEPSSQGATLGPAASAMAAAAQPGVKASGWEEHGAPDWLYNKEKQLFFAVNTGKLFWFDRKANQNRPFCEGQEHDLSVKIEGSASASGGKQGRHVVIADLHEAAAALNVDLDHIDRPAAYFAAFGCHPQAVPAETAARSLHMRLVPRLAEYRGAWSDSDLMEALQASFQQGAQASDSAEGIEAAVVLLLGDRLVAAASYAARGLVAALQSERILSFGSPEGGSIPTTLCVRLEEDVPQTVILTSGARSLSDDEMVECMSPWLARCQCRAGCVSLLQRARSAGAEGPLVAVTSHLTWGSATSSVKRPRTEPGSQVRCRHILVRHAAGRQPFDKVRRKAVKRSLEEAEALQLRVLTELGEGAGQPPCGANAAASSSAPSAARRASSAGSASSQPSAAASPAARFTAQCRSVSECDSSLKGGELAGDLGWLDPAKRYDKAPPPIPKVAMGLQVGQVSDLIATDLGIHVLKRTA